ncbi:uncharacterized protein HKW66_Vig0006930 [Vigna angularis]|uniref:Uncharacterized protein n=1 Tax=Phaseolus angularis TaxID=3914 RepID=A0A8T0LGT5_PHAAN|nr:uncharacterized protein HKW66_Vig0006930 [Vigna angularis]
MDNTSPPSNPTRPAAVKPKYATTLPSLRSAVGHYLTTINTHLQRGTQKRDPTATVISHFFLAPTLPPMPQVAATINTARP